MNKYKSDEDKTLQSNYTSKNQLPKQPVKERGTIVHQIDPQTNLLYKSFPSIADAVKEMKISTNTIKKSSMNDVIVNGWKWKIQ